jgi:hypothetical protein
MPESVKIALTQTSKWLGEYEHWVVPSAGATLASRLREITVQTHQENEQFPKRIQRDIIHILGYMPVDNRLGFLLSMAEHDGEALDALLASDSFDRRLEPFRYNLFATLGVYARRALLAEIFSDERMKRAEEIMEGQS